MGEGWEGARVGGGEGGGRFRLVVVYVNIYELLLHYDRH